MLSGDGWEPLGPGSLLPEASSPGLGSGLGAQGRDPGPGLRPRPPGAPLSPEMPGGFLSVKFLGAHGTV